MSHDDITAPVNDTPESSGGPVRASSRLAGMDVLRGFALMGVCLVNLPYMALPTEAVSATPTEAWPLIHAIAWTATFAIFEYKFITLFSLLFGAGLVLQARSAERRGERFGPVYARRLGLLLVFGLIHGVTLFMGDILSCYAVAGGILFLCRHWSPRRLTWAAVILLLVNFLALGAVQALIFDDASDFPVPWQPDLGLTAWPGTLTPSELWGAFSSTEVHGWSRIELLIFREGPWASQLLIRGVTYLSTLTIGLLIMSWQVVATFFLGAALMKAGLFEPEGRALRRRLCLGGLVLGLASEIASTTTVLNATTPLVGGLGRALHGITGLVLGLGYAGAVLIWAERGTEGDDVGARLRRALASTGRMALTHYLSQSIVGVLVFTSVGLGLFGTIGRPGLLPLALTVFALQMTVSPWWFARFRYGPFEWLWRVLTYGPRRV